MWSGVTETYPSATARWSEFSVPVQVIVPPPIQKISRPQGSFIRVSESEK